MLDLFKNVGSPTRVTVVSVRSVLLTVDSIISGNAEFNKAKDILQATTLTPLCLPPQTYMVAILGIVWVGEGDSSFRRIQFVLRGAMAYVFPSRRW